MITLEMANGFGVVGGIFGRELQSGLAWATEQIERCGEL